MLFYKVLDSVHSARRGIITDELLTESELKRQFGINCSTGNVPVYLCVVDVKKNDTFWSFGRRFQIRSNENE